jgi:hypothetical protein
VELRYRKYASETVLVEPDSLGTPDDTASEPRVDNTNVSVSYGIHHGRYPIGGLTVREARATLQNLINIDLNAVAVINGAEVDENQQITPGVTLLSFVKPTALRGGPAAWLQPIVGRFALAWTQGDTTAVTGTFAGPIATGKRRPAERITIEGECASLSDARAGTQTISVERFVQGIADAMVQGFESEALPDNVKWKVRRGNLTVFVIEFTPELRWIKWLADDSPQPFGPEATYADRRLATPYVVLKVPFRGQRIVPRIEVFYRTAPLTCWDGDGGALFWPNLYNVSVNAYNCTAWYCSQFLPSLRAPIGIQAGLEEVAHHLFSAGFNASSEFHEGLSTFGLYAKEGGDPRIADVKRWEAESIRDSRFVLDVKWKPTGLTVKDLMERELTFHRMSVPPKSTRALGNILLRELKPK